VAVADRLGRIDGENAAAYRDRAAALAGELRALDGELRDGLRDCARRDVVTSHAAFGYLTARYGLTQTGISGLSPEAEPPPGRIAEVARHVRRNGVTTVFFEELVSPEVAKTIAREAGATTAVLDPIESGDDYAAAMRANLAALRTGLGCR
jgi:zinc transport system substrate-binding protein